MAAAGRRRSGWDSVEDWFVEILKGSGNRSRTGRSGRTSRTSRRRPSGREAFRDYPGDDFQEAWEELNDFLGGDSGGAGGAEAGGAGAGRQQRSRSSQSGPSQSGPSQSGPSRSSRRRGDPPDKLREDFQILEVSFGAPLEEVRRSYKRLLRLHHPDRHASNPQKQQEATLLTQSLNGAYQRIAAWYQSKEQ